jgi:ribosomal-protein-alanine N-acetyltransferase
MTSRYLFRQMDPADLLDQERRRSVYFSGQNEEGHLVGFFQFERDDDTIDVGLGPRPDLTGRGLGAEFVLSRLASARERFSPGRFTLCVAAFNGRAGFRRGEVFTHETNGGEHGCLSMRRAA